MNKPFDLEAFKAGQKALTRDGRVASFIGICNECEDARKLVVFFNDTIMTYYLTGTSYRDASLKTRFDLVSMVSTYSGVFPDFENAD